MFASCAAAVLAGGRGQRFGGDKPLALFRGTTLVGHLLAQLEKLRFAQLIIAAKEPEALREKLVVTAGAPDSLAIDWVADADATFTPLAGLIAALRVCRTDWLFACAADMPFAADRALLEALFAASADQAAVVPVDTGAMQPLCALWNRARCFPIAEAMLRAGHAGPRRLLIELGAKQLAWADPRPFLDADTREALAELERRLALAGLGLGDHLLAGFFASSAFSLASSSGPSCSIETTLPSIASTCTSSMPDFPAVRRSNE